MSIVKEVLLIISFIGKMSSTCSDEDVPQTLFLPLIRNMDLFRLTPYH